MKPSRPVRPLKKVRQAAPPSTEYSECTVFVDWTKLAFWDREPLFERIFKIPNERGGRHAIQVRDAGRLARIGVKKGFPDYGILIPLRPYAGAFIEAKRPGGRVDPDQVAWRNRLIGFGYWAAIAEDGLDMIRLAREYLGGSPLFRDPARLE